MPSDLAARLAAWDAEAEAARQAQLALINEQGTPNPTPPPADPGSN